MNEVNILLADKPGFKFVKVVFPPHTGKRSYTYKTLLDINVDDYAVVDTPSNGMQVVKVVDVLQPMEVDFDVKFSYKWLVQKVDTAAYEELQQTEQEMLAVVNKSKNKRAIAEAKEAILEGMEDEDIKKLVRL
jgi:uncharacterized protein YbbC (DUF1343 family)